MLHPADLDRQPILVAEDSPDDQILIRRAFLKTKAKVSLIFFDNGEDIIRYIGTVKSKSDLPGARDDVVLPLAVLLDLKLPRKSGLDVLAFIKSTETIKRIPVIVLTASEKLSDVNDAYDLGVNSYLMKPVEFASLSRIITHFNAYWMTANVPPTM
jgi:CheY-like chemotaxis protein